MRIISEILKLIIVKFFVLESLDSFNRGEKLESAFYALIVLFVIWDIYRVNRLKRKYVEIQKKNTELNEMLNKLQNISKKYKDMINLENAKNSLKEKNMFFKKNIEV